jgi:hypothetical protein
MTVGEGEARCSVCDSFTIGSVLTGVVEDVRIQRGARHPVQQNFRSEAPSSNTSQNLHPVDRGREEISQLPATREPLTRRCGWTLKSDLLRV